MFSCGSRRIIEATTVNPPMPESKTPIGFACSGFVAIAVNIGKEAGFHKLPRLRLRETFRILLTANPPDPGAGFRILITRHIPVERIVILFFHFIGFGLFVTLNVAGYILHRHYLKAPDLAAKAVVLRAARTVGLLSPVAVVIMLVTGIGNMHELGLGILDAGWLTAKIIFFTLAVISGTLLGIQASKRGKLVGQMIAGAAPADAATQLAGLDRQLGLGHLVMPILLTIIVLLSIYGRVGGA